MDGSEFEYEDQDNVSEFEYEDQGMVLSDGEQDDDPMVIEPPEVRKAPYVVMNRSELIDRQMRSITDVSELLDVSNEEGFLLLRAHAWDMARLQEAWFENEAKVREKCGLGPAAQQRATQAKSASSSASPQRLQQPVSCPICMQLVSEKLISLDCGHGFCKDCWRGYLHAQVDDGKASVGARCPQHKCGRVVPSNFVTEFCDEERQKKYQEWYLRTYVDDNPCVKWCTSPAGCPLACEYLGGDACDIRCMCTFVWCWACGEEAHRPADCKLVSMWNIKNSAESENISWISANTKKCPKCHKPIEKNQGCNHMICSKAGGCGHEFCWLCLGEWSTHGTSTGGYYQCNIYDKQAKEGKHVVAEQSRQKAKHALDKYIFYYERFMDHDRGMKLTRREEEDVEGKVQTLHDKHGFEIIELQFLYDALRQVRACRRVLKWTYVYGYYLEEAGPEKNLFEHLQKNLEEKTDCLHEMLEKDFDAIFFNDESSGGLVPLGPEAHTKFMDFRSHVTNFTNVTQKFASQILTDLSGQGLMITQDAPRIAGTASTRSHGGGRSG